MKIIFALLIFLIVLCSILNREYFENFKKNNPIHTTDRLKEYIKPNKNNSLKLLNNYMKSEGVKQACEKLYEYCGKDLNNDITDEQKKYTNGKNCNQFKDYPLGLCTQSVYDDLTKKIINGDVLISSSKNLSSKLLPYANPYNKDQDYFLIGKHF